MVPSPSMGRDIKVQFQGGGKHAVVLLDGLRRKTTTTAGTSTPRRSNGSTIPGLSVVMPVGGESSFYSDGINPHQAMAAFRPTSGRRSWTQELPAWLAANKGVQATGNQSVASMAGSASLVLAATTPTTSFTPVTFRLSQLVERHLADPGRLRD